MKFDDKNERATVSLRANELLPKLQEKELADPQSKLFFYYTQTFMMPLLNKKFNEQL